jgi:uncharacterized protein (DUF1697 family)
MATYVALLRGINVGTAKRVAMADLRDLLGALGYTDVRTLLNSGNAVFTAGAAAARNAGTRIEQALVKRLGVASRVLVFSGAELTQIVAENPLIEVSNNHSRLMVAFLVNGADRERPGPLARRSWGKERLHIGARAVYYWCPESILTSPVSTAVGKALGDAMTVRNWNTVLRLHALVDPRA